jgi:hypothetical protein
MCRVCPHYPDKIYAVLTTFFVSFMKVNERWAWSSDIGSAAVLSAFSDQQPRNKLRVREKFVATYEY